MELLLDEALGAVIKLFVNLGCGREAYGSVRHQKLVVEGKQHEISLAPCSRYSRRLLFHSFFQGVSVVE